MEKVIMYRTGSGRLFENEQDAIHVELNDVLQNRLSKIVPVGEYEEQEIDNFVDITMHYTEEIAKLLNAYLKEKSNGKA